MVVSFSLEVATYRCHAELVTMDGHGDLMEVTRCIPLSHLILLMWSYGKELLTLTLLIQSFILTVQNKLGRGIATPPILPQAQPINL